MFLERFIEIGQFDLVLQSKMKILAKKSKILKFLLAGEKSGVDQEKT